MKKVIFAVALSISLNVFAEQSTIDNITLAANNMQVENLTELAAHTSGYDQAFAHYKLGAAYLVQQNFAKLTQHLTLSADILNQQLKHNPKDVESMILLAQVLGLHSGFAPEKAKEFGPKTYELLNKAGQLAPKNPRLKLVHGIIKYHTPAAYGGNKQVAVAMFNQAINNYPDDVHSGYHWGYDEAYIWHGLAKVEQGDTKGALLDFNQAVEINPNSNWAKGLIAQNEQNISSL
ncbi:tetratricopeptide repeat protein [Catenovulum sediminis]|uniref:tetratricopeptide repeat protein n=1 Tax=Catenovulum sediminis TaxID=1740262 RepID=UPI00117E518D|nr:tetratricopeptide repeat protein [Catenovulum sediminis]